MLPLKVVFFHNGVCTLYLLTFQIGLVTDHIVDILFSPAQITRPAKLLKMICSVLVFRKLLLNQMLYAFNHTILKSCTICLCTKSLSSPPPYGFLTHFCNFMVHRCAIPNLSSCYFISSMVYYCACLDTGSLLVFYFN